MGDKLQNATPPTNRSWKPSNFSWIFFPMVLIKPSLGLLEFWNWNFNDVFVNIGPYGSQNFKVLLLLQIAAECFQTLPGFFSMVLRLGFLKFWNWNFNEFIALLDYSQAEGYTMGLMASHTFVFSNQIFSKNSLWQFSQKVLTGILWNFEFNLFKKIQIYHCGQWEMKICQHLGRAAVEQNRVKFGTRGCVV